MTIDMSAWRSVCDNTLIAAHSTNQEIKKPRKSEALFWCRSLHLWHDIKLTINMAYLINFCKTLLRKCRFLL